MSRLADILDTSVSSNPQKTRKRARRSHVVEVDHRNDNDDDLEQQADESESESDNDSVEGGPVASQASPNPQRNHHEVSSSRSRRVKAPRKRSVTACNLCRVRKAKCDNARPSCAYCIRHGVTCTYAGDNTDQKHLFDPVSLEIINRLEEIKRMLSASSPALDTPPAPPPPLPQDPRQTPVSGTVRLADDATPVTIPESPSGSRDHAALRTATSCYRTSGEEMLRWPIFEGILPVEEGWVRSFLLDSSVDLDVGSAGADVLSRTGRPAPVGPGSIPKDDHVRLCSRYLAYVHPRNPVVDEAELMACARETAEHGLAWDARSCLVLLACALALATSPWKPNDDQVVEEDIEAGEVCFLEARKRFGLLQTSIMDMQCLFLAVTYEKCCLRPLRAWNCLEQACSRLQTHLSRKRRRVGAAERSEDHATELLEQRLFWSCVKAESEFMFEFPLRPTGIIDLPYPVAFPHPPEVPTDESTPGAGNTDPALSKLDARGMERSWFFYFAEISVRRTMIDTVEMLYHRPEQRWDGDLPALLRKHDECQEKISIWHAHLPTLVKFDYEKRPDNELSSYLKVRFQTWQIMVSRPLVYQVIHRQRRRGLDSTAVGDEHHDKSMAQARNIAQQCVYASANIVTESSKLHRHGGTWMTCRTVFALSLLILASVLSGGELDPPPNWRHTIKTANDILLRWGLEAADVEWMRSTLVGLFNAVCDR